MDSMNLLTEGEIEKPPFWPCDGITIFRGQSYGESLSVILVLAARSSSGYVLASTAASQTEPLPRGRWIRAQRNRDSQVDSRRAKKNRNLRPKTGFLHIWAEFCVKATLSACN